MAENNPSFFARLGLACKTLFNPTVANKLVNALDSQTAEATPAPVTEVAVSKTEFRTTDADSALQLLSIMQQEGRLIDFLKEDVSQFSDTEIGAAARVVHQGIAKVLAEHFTIEPVRNEDENSNLTLEAGFDASQVRLTGNVVGSAPYRGILVHRGWQVTQVTLPQLGETHNVKIIAPAEVEL